MHRSTVHTRAMVGIDSPSVTVETHLQAGTPGFILVGLPESALRESRTRVKSAVQNSGFPYPQQRVVVNLAPANLAKEGTRYDLAIALSILTAVGTIKADAAAKYEFLGELGLFGEVRATRGCLCAALAAQAKHRTLVVPAANYTECAGITDNVVAVRHLSEVVGLVNSAKQPPQPSPEPQPATESADSFDHIIGQEAAKRALVVAAAGGHHMLMVGPPGAGKTLLAQSFTELLPRLSVRTATEVAAIYSAAGLPAPGPRPPLRAPHHSASAAALVGGGPNVTPGEITLAHEGVLFLDELPHFKPSVLDHLREPLQAREILLSRAKLSLRYPAGFQLIAAMNPCPAGRTCDTQNCRCTPNQRDRYQARLSGPLLDRIDLHVHVPELPAHRMTEPGTPGAALAARALVLTARERQLRRWDCLSGVADTRRLTQGVTDEAVELLNRAVERAALTARSFHKMLRVAHTIAAIEASETVRRAHMAEALTYRALDWENGVAG